MQAAGTEPSSTAESGMLRRHWATLLALVALMSVLLLVLLVPGLRALAADTWREMLTISPLSLALIAALKIGQSLCSALTWRNALLAGWPRANLPYRFVLGVDQGQDVLNTVVPARGGTWTMLGVFRLSIPGARMPTILAVWAVQSLAFALFAAVNYTLIATGLPNRTQESRGVTDRASGIIAERPVLSAAIAAIALLALVLVAVRSGQKIRQTWNQIRDGFAILGTPGRYVRLIFLPSLAAYGFRAAAYAALLDAFHIPVTLWTLVLALGSQSLAGAVRITPGGIGTTQAIDVIALRDYAPPEVVTAYSLSEIALSFVLSVTLSLVALISVNGWHGTRNLLRPAPQETPSAKSG
jgi:hypothetical protein